MLTILILFELRPASGWEQQLSTKSQLVLFATYFFPLPSIQFPALFATFSVLNFHSHNKRRVDSIGFIYCPQQQQQSEWIRCCCRLAMMTMVHTVRWAREKIGFFIHFSTLSRLWDRVYFPVFFSHFSSLSHPSKKSSHFTLYSGTLRAIQHT